MEVKELRKKLEKNLKKNRKIKSERQLRTKGVFK